MRRRVCMLASLVAVIVTVANIAYFVKDSYFYSLENLPVGTPIPSKVIDDTVYYEFYDDVLFLVPQEETEESGYYIRFFEVNVNGKQGIRAEACRNDIVSGDIMERKTIYWQIGTAATVLAWEDYTVVNINGVTIDFSKDVYDCRDYVDFKYKPAVLNDQNWAQ